MTEWDNNYYWVVLCKNTAFHFQKNAWFDHLILLGETDAVSPLPPLQSSFIVKCDRCGREYPYLPGDVLRYEVTPPDAFVPHPLFAES